MIKCVLKAFDKTKPLIRYTAIPPSWTYSYVEKCRLEGAGEREGDGFVFGKDVYEDGVVYAGRVKFKDVYTYNFDRHIVKLWGNIGNVFDNVQVFKGNYGYWARSSKVTDVNNQLMHAGCDLFLGGQFAEINKAGVLIMDKDAGGGQWTFINTIFEYNAGAPVYIDLLYPYQTLWSPMTFIACWFEGNATAQSVEIDTLSGKKTINPIDAVMQNGGVYPAYINLGVTNQIGTTKAKGMLNVWGNERAALALYGGKFGSTDTTAISFLSDDDPQELETAFIKSTKTANSFKRDLEFGAYGKLVAHFGVNGKIIIGSMGLKGTAIGSEKILTLACNEDAAGGEEILNIKAGGGFPTRFYQADGVGVNPAQAVLKIGRVVATNRSINAAGTINAAGADYAEYMQKSNDCGIIDCGDICGIDENGLLTDKFKNAISFVVKSTNPSMVGGDTWFTENPPSKAEHDEHGYAKALAEYNERFDKAAKKVDRIAFCGQVPVNINNAKVGDFIIAANANDNIIGVPVTNPNFEQYMSSIGKVIKIIDDDTVLAIIKVI